MHGNSDSGGCGDLLKDAGFQKPFSHRRPGATPPVRKVDRLERVRRRFSRKVVPEKRMIARRKERAGCEGHNGIFGIMVPLTGKHGNDLASRTYLWLVFANLQTTFSNRPWSWQNRSAWGLP